MKEVHLKEATEVETSEVEDGEEETLAPTQLANCNDDNFPFCSHVLWLYDNYMAGHQQHSKQFSHGCCTKLCSWLFAYSRASNHATADLIKLNQAKAYTDRAKLMVGNGDKSQIANVSISFLSAIKDKYLLLNGFLHVPLLQ